MSMILWTFEITSEHKKTKTNTESLCLTSGISYQRNILYFTKIFNGNFGACLTTEKVQKSIVAQTDTVVLDFFNICEYKVLKYI